MKQTLDLAWWQVALAAGFLLLPAWLSFREHLGIHRDLLIGGLRCCAQLLLIGYLLRLIFGANQWYWVVLLLATMMVIGGHTAIGRLKHPVDGSLGMATASIVFTSVLTLAYLTEVVVRVHPWWDPRYLIPLAGMVIGNAMNGSAQAAERLSAELRLRRQEVEVLLSLGASPRQACAEAIAATVRASLIPTINGLMSVGLVHLPGMMTGQMLGGAAPSTAVRYQIVIFYALTFVSTATAILMTALAYRRYFTPRMQLVARYFVGS